VSPVRRCATGWHSCDDRAMRTLVSMVVAFGLLACGKSGGGGGVATGTLTQGGKPVDAKRCAAREAPGGAIADVTMADGSIVRLTRGADGWTYALVHGADTTPLDCRSAHAKLEWTATSSSASVSGDVTLDDCPGGVAVKLHLGC